jgi:hypothetical protein
LTFSICNLKERRKEGGEEIDVMSEGKECEEEEGRN